MDSILRTLINIYNMTDTDWMGYKLQDRFSYHHIIKKMVKYQQEVSY